MIINNAACPFIGRELEVLGLRAVLDALLTGEGGVVVLEGEPGIGKTRLARKFATDAAELGVNILWKTCRDAGDSESSRETNAPYAEYVPAGRALERISSVDGIIEAELALRGPTKLDDDNDVSLSVDLAQLVAAVGFPAVTNKSQARAIVFEDADRAEKRSLDLLRAIALDSGPVLIIVTCNAAALRTREVLTHELFRGARRMRLRPFEGAAFAQLVQSYAGLTPDTATQRRLRQISGGNPRFLQLIVDSDLTRLEEIDGGAHLPHMLRSAAQDHLQAIAGPHRSLLRVAAMIGRTFEFRVLEEVCQQLNEQVGAALAEAQAAGLIEPLENPPSSFKFVYQLVRYALCAEVPTGEAIRLHQQIGQALESRHGADREYWIKIAEHFFSGRSAGVHNQDAVQYCKRAAEQAAKLRDFPRAIALYEMALGSMVAGGADGSRCDLLAALASVQNRAGDSGPAFRNAMHAAELAELNCDKTRYAGAALAVAGNTWHLAAGGRDVPSVAPILEKSLRMLGNSNEPATALVATRLAAHLYSQSKAAERQHALLQRATAIAQESNDPEALLSIRQYQYLVLLSQPGGSAERLQIAEEMLQVAASLERSEEWCAAFILRQTELLRVGDITQAEQGAADLAKAAQRTGEAIFGQVLALWWGVRAILDGRFEEALSICWQFLELAEKALPEVTLVSVLSSAVTMLRELGRLDELEPIVERSAKSQPWLLILPAVQAQIRLRRGDVTGARAILRGLLSRGFDGCDRDASRRMYLPIVAELCAELREHSHVAELYNRFLSYQSLNIIVSPIGFAGPAARYLGILATMQRRFEDAERHFLDAARLTARTCARPWTAYTELHYAHMLVERDGPWDRERAVALIASALTTARALSMKDLLARAEELQDRIEFSGRKLARPDQLGEHRTSREHLNHYSSDPVTPAALPAPAALQADSAPDNHNGLHVNEFRREGDYWTLEFAGHTVRLKHAKGLSMISCLLRQPRRDFLALELERLSAGGAVPNVELKADQFVRELTTRNGADDSGPVIDVHARTAYQQRLRELNEELTEAKSLNDAGGISKKQTEIEFLQRELVHGVGFAGRARKWPSEIERSRVNVTNAVRSVLAKIRSHNPDLARYLANTIKTGRFCSFEPDPLVPADWRV